MNQIRSKFRQRFRGYLPIVVDVETAGFNHETDALLEIAVIFLKMSNEGYLSRDKTLSFHILPFKGANLDPAALEFTGIMDPYHPFRYAVEEKLALEEIFKRIDMALENTECKKAILVGHNSTFDLSFVKSAAERSGFKRTPFHPFSTFDTVSLSALALGQTVLARALECAKIEFDHSQAHSATYDAEKTADLFCYILNRWQQLGGWDNGMSKPTFPTRSRQY